MNLSSFKFTNRDLNVLTTLWNAQKSMTASELAAFNPELNINTVQVVLRKLLKSGLVKVADIVYSGTVLSRSYVPTVSETEFALYKLTSEYKQVENYINLASLVKTLLETESDKEKVEEDIKQLKEMLETYQQN